MNKKILGLILLFLAVSSSWAQTDTIYIRKDQILILEDSIIAPSSDTIFVCHPHTRFKLRRNPYATSEEFYSKIKEKASGNKVAHKLSKLFLTEPDKPTQDLAETGKSSHEVFAPYEGKFIRSIEFKHVDVLEGSVLDTGRTASSNIAIIANKYHSHSRDWVVKSNLSFTEGEPIDPYTLSDNERLIRRLLYIEDAKIYITEIADSELVDVIIVIKDRFAWGFRGRYSTDNQLELEAYNRSVGGLGRYASLSYYHHNNYAPHNGYNFQIGGQNSLKAITSWSINRSDYWDRKDFGIQAQKNFVTPRVRYGGGFEYRMISDTTISLDGDVEEGDFYRMDFRDIWFGRAFQLKTGGERKNITLSARIRDNHFYNQPQVTSDSNEIYYNRTLVLGQIAYTKQKFIKSSYVVGFGISEDIPIGYRASFLYGKDFNQFYTQNYFGVDYYFSRFFNHLGYFLVSQQFGGFAEDAFKTGVIGCKVSYFSPLWGWSGYKNRNYFNLGYTNGIRQPMARSLNLGSRIRDINGDGIYGENAFYMKLESSWYTPWYFYGFRFAPFLYTSYSKIKDNRTVTSIVENYFQSVGLGIRMKNESLVFNTFEIRATRFWSQNANIDNFLINISVSTPITFENIFSYKPRLIPYE
ncbi:hypothetical protein [Marinoscillum sp. MHG1-6]|uniref:hypothetical protein n=1 Tax=Marinoscillum sp. MHG1-6 TaxID=2959627 RepID=UPI0021578AFA|nr:hypothetical protein [Marinoscillum sp. MHG1-6]